MAGASDDSGRASYSPNLVGVGADRPRRWRALAVAVVVGGWMAVQVAVPVWRLVERGGAPRPRTHGWQMFTHRIQQPAERFYVTTADGSRREFPAFTLIDGPMRREVVYAPAVVPELCARPEVVAVEVHDVEHGDSETRCR